MDTAGFPCAGCGDATRATEVDRYVEKGQVVALKLRCSMCGGIFIADL